MRGRTGSFLFGLPPNCRGGVAPPLHFFAIVDQQVYGVVSGVGLPMRFTSELTIKAAWQIVASGHEQWELTSSIERERLAKVRKV